ncbi:MAG TPA: hypothetical protein PLA50_20495, partial [Bacteroidia bacterium]|nr:hypothetical protein [Bacteroidia bacterium]
EDLWATPFYVPPEKLEGDADTFLGDIYSLGATLFHALAGKPPFDANTPSMEELKEIKRAPVDLRAAAPGLSKATVRLVEKMMAYRPEDRIPGYDELISQIEHVRSRRFGVADSRRGTRSARPHKGVWLAAAGVAAVIAIAVLALRPRPVEEPEIGIQTGERAVAVGDNTISGQFLSARGHLVAGRFDEAGKAFESLAANEAVTGSTKVWSLFLIGMNRLFLGDLGPAREAFQSAAESTTEVSPENAEAVAFLKRAAKTLTEPLPVLPGDAAYDPGSVEAIGLLAAGLKNWQHGEFSSAVEHFKAFQQAEVPESVAWMRDLKKRVEPFLADHALIAALPNPRASSPAPQLAAEEETLRKGLDSLRTKGAAPQMLKRRIDRIAEIRK